MINGQCRVARDRSLCVSCQGVFYRSLVRILCYQSRVLQDRFDSRGSRPQITGKMLPQTPDIIPTTLNQVSGTISIYLHSVLFHSFRVVTFNLKVRLFRYGRCFYRPTKTERPVYTTRDRFVYVFQEFLLRNTFG